VRGDSGEALLSSYLADYVERGKPGLSHVARHPGRSSLALAALYQLPVATAVTSDSVEGRAVRAWLTRPSAVGRTSVHSVTALLPVPEDPAQYLLGASKQTLRRKIRAAERAGIWAATVEDPAHRRQLLELANDHERHHVLEEYREPDPDNDDLLDYGLWLVAFSAEARPLLLCVTPVDGDWAVLRYFRTFGAGDEQSNARYLMTRVLVEHLSARGVRFLADTSSPVGLQNGLRHFQRMLGFRLYRVQLGR
jgi:hypothetical protein